MNPGQRNEQIAFERLVATPDGAGGRTETWRNIGRAWAAVKWLSGSETERDGSMRTLTRYRFTVPSEAIEELKLTTRDRIIWGADALNIRERPRRLIHSPEAEIVAETGVTS